MKNYTLEAVLSESNSEKIEDVFNYCLIRYKEVSPKEGKYKEAWGQRLRLRKEIDDVIYRNHQTSDIIKHFWTKDQSTPIWALFEIMTLGNFGLFFSCMTTRAQGLIFSDLNMPNNYSSDCLTKIIFALKDLRNAVAHNGVVFDTRFRTGKISQNIGNLMKNEMRISTPIDFGTITDYAVLVLYLMCSLRCSKTECRQFLNAYSDILSKYDKALGRDICTKIFGTSSKKKLGEALQYVKGI